MEFDSLLDALQSQDRSTRNQAESALDAIEIQEGFAELALMRIRDPHYPLPRRQLVLTIIKEVVRTRWHELSEALIGSIMRGLLPVVADANSSVRALSHSCLALSASRMPESHWAQLFDMIEKAFASNDDPDSVKALLDLLAEIIDECGGSRFVPVVDRVGAVLLNASGGTMARKCFSVFSRLLVVLAQDEEFEALKKAGSDAWAPVLFKLSESTDIGDRVVVLKYICEMIKHDLEPLVRPSAASAVDQCLIALNQWSQPYQSLIILAEEGGADEDENGLSCFIISICEFFNAIVLLDEPLVICSQEQFARFIIAMATYNQLSLSIEEEFLHEPGEYVASEQDDLPGVTVRTAFEGVIADVADSPYFNRTANVSLLAAAKQLLEESASARAAGNSEWWRIAEAGLLYLGLVEVDSSTEAHAVELVRSAASLSVQRDLPPLLQSRAFSTLAKQSQVVARHFQSDLIAIVRFAASEIRNSSVPVAFAACGAFSAFLKAVEADVRQELSFGGNGVVSSLMDLSSTSSSPEVVSFCLEALLGVARTCSPGFGERVDSRFERFVGDMLKRHVDDPLTPTQLMELVEASNLTLTRAESASELVAMTLRPWLLESAESRLDVALDCLAVIVRVSPVPFPVHLADCLNVLRGGSLSGIGPETNSCINGILQTCADRHPVTP